MCRVGDIILIIKYIGEDGTRQRNHPFIVLNDSEGKIEGLPFDLTCSVMSSFKNEKHRKKKLSMKQNLEITVEDGVKKDGFIKANQIHYFQKDKLDYIVVGSVTPELFTELMKLIEELFKDEEILVNTSNL